ncbi:MAG: beta-galactosidase/beta-glucuronidase, partial [Planctomycetota bacterium]
MTQPRPEHPRPQFQRENWLNLNGEWAFCIDHGDSGREAGWPEDPAPLTQKINVPFCPESPLSGIAHTDFMPAVWYHRPLAIPSSWSGQRVLLHFGAVDYECHAWVNGQSVGIHYGGSSSFHFDITAALKDGDNQLVVLARDDGRSGLQPNGKQSTRLHSHGCHYTRTTGIWQTVWLEAVPSSQINCVRIVADFDGARFVLTPTLSASNRNHTFRAVLLHDGQELNAATMSAQSGSSMALKIPSARPWSPSDPHLYDLRFELTDGEKTIDCVHSYAGLRKFHIEGNKFFLNNEPIFLRFVLDQGFYPDGIWTAPDDTDLK